MQHGLLLLDLALDGRILGSVLLAVQLALRLLVALGGVGLRIGPLDRAQLGVVAGQRLGQIFENRQG